MLSQDLRYALRGLRRSPGFTAVAILTLALGIGANTAIFSLLETVMFRALPVRHPEQLVELLQKYPGEPRGNGYWTRRSFEHFRDNNHVFSVLIATSFDNRVRLAADPAETETGIAEYVTSNYFPDLGIKPALGRLIRPEGEGAQVAVISWSRWTGMFHGDPGILGKQIRVQNVPATVIGVTPPEFTGLRVEAKTDVWLPLPPDRNGLALVGRLRPGATLRQARAEMPVLYRFTIEERAAGSNDPLVRQLAVEVEPAGNGLATARDRSGTPLLVLMAVTGVLLLLACVNMASLLLARAAGREREMAVRTSLGASRARLMRQVLTESLLLSTTGTAAGVIVAWFGASALARIMASGRQLSRVSIEVRPDIPILLFTAAVAVLAGLVFGAAPAWRALRIAPAGALRQAGGASETRSGRLFGKGLVVAQVALSALLLCAASLFAGNLARLERADLGFRRDHVLLVALDPGASGYTGDRLYAPYRELLDRVQAIPGVRSVTMSGPTPLEGSGASGFATAEGFEERPEDRRWNSISYVAPRYFETLGIPLVAGRELRMEDQARPNVAIINQTLARYYFAGHDPIGKRITLEHVTGMREPRTYEIVGVSADANYMEIRETSRRGIYLPAFHDGRAAAHTFVIRTSTDPAGIASTVRAAIREVLPAVPIARIDTLSGQIDATIVPERLIAVLSSFFGVLGAVLAGIGLYGLLAYSVARRTNEIGVRLALGATTREVSAMVLRDAAVTVVLGLTLAIPAGLWGMSLAAKLIPEAELSVAPLTWAALGILGVAFLASYIPVRRAARVDPIQALRQE
jgi:putative ABC transport system permease protein